MIITELKSIFYKKFCRNVHKKLLYSVKHKNEKEQYIISNVCIIFYLSKLFLKLKKNILFYNKNTILIVILVINKCILCILVRL